MTFKQLTHGNRRRDNDVIIYSLVSDCREKKSVIPQGLQVHRALSGMPLMFSGTKRQRNVTDSVPALIHVCEWCGGDPKRSDNQKLGRRAILLTILYTLCSFQNRLIPVYGQ